MDELNHRVKNTLATVQSIAMQTRRATETPAAFEAAFLARLDALARVHDLLSRRLGRRIAWRRWFRQTLAPHLVAEQSRSNA